ncbi:MAG: agmatine deiminase family protein [Methanoregulaceae archaeon]|nr:agmatine deiminase family protein [Methanoregulaceae archaeon]
MRKRFHGIMEGFTTIGLIQLAVGNDPQENLEHAGRLAEEAIGRGAKIVCLPELYRTRYFPVSLTGGASLCAETVPGESTGFFSDLARKHGVVIIVPVFEKGRDGRFYNTAVVIDADGSLLAPYRKTHIPQDPGFWEKGYFTPGDGYRVHSTAHGRIAVLICYDQWFPETARCVALEGADLIIFPTAIGHPGGTPPREGDWHEAWELIQRSHAIANSVHVAAVNRTGRERGTEFFGGSFVCDSFGHILARAGGGEEIVIAALDLTMNRTVRDTWGFFRNRRPDTYGGICSPSPVVGARALSGTPRNMGFSMPAEWEPHDSVWLAWPQSEDTFPHLERVEETYCELIVALQDSETVDILVPPDEAGSRARDILAGAGADPYRVRFHPADYADVWIRDYGPTFVRNRSEEEVSMVRWKFNAWGGKYEHLLGDGEVPGMMNRWLDLPVFEPGIVLEGGSIEVNGCGTVMTTTSCLLNPNRNPSLSGTEIEEYLKEYTGAVKVIWLGEGIAGDDTDGHIDDIARFVGPSTVVCAYEESACDENYAPLHHNYTLLRGETDQDGNPLNVVKLPMPGMVSGSPGERYPASYANFYIGNRVVVVPVFDDPKDADALRILQGMFPDRRVIGIDARAMVEGRGAFHCATQQQPLRDSG